MDLDMDVNETKAPLVRRTAIAMLVLSTLAVSLRLWSRMLSLGKRKLWWDDVFALLAWADSIYAVHLGYGRHITTIEPKSNITTILKFIYAGSIIFDWGITFAKISVLLFYARVFHQPSRLIRTALIVTWVQVLAFIAYKMPAQVFACVPPRKYWEPTTPGTCSNDNTSFSILLSGLLLDVIADIFILLLPIPVIRKLQISRQRKVILLAAFLCGYATFIASIVRMAAYIKVRDKLQDPDFTFVPILPLVWSLVQLPFSVVSICIPNLFHLSKHVSENGFYSVFGLKRPLTHHLRLIRIRSDASSNKAQAMRPQSTRNRSSGLITTSLQPKNLSMSQSTV